LNLLLPFRRIARREDQSPKRSHFRDRKPARRLLGASSKLSLRFLRTIPVPVRRHVGAKDSASHAGNTHREIRNRSLSFPQTASKQSLPTTLGYNQDPRSVEFIPAGVIPAIANTAPRILGWQGRTRVPCFDTPSLNPGLWYTLYPPIVVRRQAKKCETL